MGTRRWAGIWGKTRLSAGDGLADGGVIVAGRSFFFSGVVVRWAVARETTSASSVSMFTSDSSSDETIQEKEVESAEFPSRSDVMSSTTCFVCLTVSCSSSDESESSAMRLAMVKDLLSLVLVSIGDDRLVA